ncbi:hypothetical protein TWF718_005628 [Orbilia javanica]|uniref:Putative transcription factor kapC n=1 Tax=Orbilia javanica TaxID=47235 RepID=A0AAN8N3X4_9PEZI
MTEVVSMANGHRTLPAPTLTSTQVPHNFLKLLLLPVEEAPRVSSATNIPSFTRFQDQQHTSHHHLNHHNHHHHQQQQHTPSSSAEQPSRKSLPMESEPPASSQPVRDWGIDPHLGKDTELLRKQLLSAISGEEPMQQPTPMSSQQPPSSSPTVLQRNDIRPSSSLSPGSGGEDSSKADSRQKRELNTSKRAAQNRNAQRAFRARKEEYIKSLESKVRDYEAVEERNAALEGENAALRQYIMHLQRRLLDHLGEGEALPDPPAGLNIENLHISSRPPSARMSLKPELPPISALHDKALTEPVAGVKRVRVDE